MNRDDILRMAREAGVEFDDEASTGMYGLSIWERFAALVAAHAAARIEMPYMDMTPYEIVDMAEKAGFRIERWDTCFGCNASGSYLELREFAYLAAAAEREACARVCEARYMGDNNREDMEAKRCAAAIRARGEGFVRKTHQSSDKTIEPQERAPDYLEKCPNCNGPADNGFDRSWPDPNPYFCTKCMKAMEY